MTAFPLGTVDNVKPFTGLASASISFLATTFNANNRPDYTFTSVSFGAADASRIIAVCIYTSQAGQIVSVTIGGISATRIAGYNNGGNNEVAIYAANVPTGTSGTIFIQLPDDAGRCGIGVYRIIANYSQTPIGSDSGGVVSLSQNEYIGGATIVASVRVGSTTAYSLTRNGTSLSPDVSSLFSGSSLVKFDGASITGNPNTTTSATYSIDVNDGMMAVAHWR